MATKTRVKFNKKALARQMYNNIADKQTERLIAFAESEIIRLVETRAFTNQTINLQDSYVWAVYYKGKKAKHGFYGNKMAKGKSILHEYSPSISVDVNGRALARKFVDQLYKPDETQGWEIVFAACAPYGAYLEWIYVSWQNVTNSMLCRNGTTISSKHYFRFAVYDLR